MKNYVFILSGIYVALFLSSCVNTTPYNKPPAQIIMPQTPAPPTPIQPAPIQTIVSEHKRVIFMESSPPQNQQPAIHDLSTQGTQKHYADFDEWKQDFLARTDAQFVHGATLNTQVIRLDSNQAEFAKMPWEYLDSAVSASRVSAAKTKRREMLTLLENAENQYGVPASIVTAIWGLESSFGAGMGNTNLINALSSLAYEGRRRDFAESQLLAIGDIVNRGDVSFYELVGSWAGGMGHTQFIPTTWRDFGVDGDFDGKKSPFSKADALSSTAHYLSQSGWVRGLPVYVEVNLPSNFDYRYLGSKQSFGIWQQLGVMASESLPVDSQATLFLPTGINGPKLLTTQNFEVIKVYNNSSSYALAVATLANKMNGKAGIVADFPRDERPLSKNDIIQLQQNLTAQGYDTKGSDGIIGANTRAAFARWQMSNGQIPDGFISKRSASFLIY